MSICDVGMCFEAFWLSIIAANSSKTRHTTMPGAELSQTISQGLQAVLYI